MFPPRHEVGVLGPLLVPGPAEHLGLVGVAPAYGGVAPVAGAGQRAVGVQHPPLAARLGVAGPQQPALHNTRLDPRHTVYCVGSVRSVSTVSSVRW